MPATDAGYDTAEILACGKRWHGLGICSLAKTADITTLEVKVQGYYGGTVHWFSEGCGINYSEEYEGNVQIELSAATVIAKSCIISVTVSPKYTPEMRKDLAVHSFRGHLAVKLLPGGAWLGETRKLSGNWQDNLTVPVQGGTAATVVFRGCKKTYKETLPVSQQTVPVSLRKASDLGQGDLCVLDGFAITDKKQETSANVLMHIYNPAFSRLSIPKMELKKGSLIVSGEDAVSIVGLDDKYMLGSEAKFSFNEQLPHTLRLLTVKGRSVLCEYNPLATTPPPGAKGEWKCSQ